MNLIEKELNRLVEEGLLEKEGDGYIDSRLVKSLLKQGLSRDEIREKLI